jgi:ABC-type antimicrobial peptide transport system permease subunit
MVAWGLAAGVVGRVWLSGLLTILLFRISPHDVTTFLVVAVVLTMVALVAASVPTLRAARLEPIEALRGEACNKTPIGTGRWSAFIRLTKHCATTRE